MDALILMGHHRQLAWLTSTNPVRVSIWVLLCLLILGSALVPVQANTDFILGVATHLTRQPRPIDQSLDALADAGVISLRDDADWSRVEQERGVLKIPAQWDEVVDGAEKRGIKPLLILDYGNQFYDGGDKPVSPEAIAAFTNYARFLAQHFQGLVAYYEIWNEWDHGAGHTTPGTAASYVRLIRSVYPEIKKLDPKAKILVGGMTAGGVRGDFLSQILKLGALDYADALSLHTYVHCQKGRAAEDWVIWMREVGDKLELLAGKKVPVYITEMGWPTHHGPCGISEQTQAENLTKMFLLSKTLPFIKGIWWYDLQNDGLDPMNMEHNFGLLDHELRPKPAYLALKRISSLIREGEYVGSLTAQQDRVRALHFRKGNEDVLAIWTDDPSTCPTVQITAGEDVSLKAGPIQGSIQSLPHTKSVGQKGERIHQAKLALSSMPRLITLPTGSLRNKPIEIHCGHNTDAFP